MHGACPFPLVLRGQVGGAWRASRREGVQRCRLGGCMAVNTQRGLRTVLEPPPVHRYAMPCISHRQRTPCALLRGVIPITAPC